MGHKYTWIIGEDPPPIDSHSFAKHKVYQDYVSHYIQVLNANPMIPGANLTIIDGFAGGGEYLDKANQIYKGSPLRLMDAANEGEVLVNLQREKGGTTIPFTLNADFYFIEKNKRNYRYLEWCLKQNGYEDRINKSVFLMHADFKIALPEIITNIKQKGPGERCLFFLDQYGYKEVPFDLIRQIFRSLKKAEIVLTFATDQLIDFVNTDDKFQKAIKNLNLIDGEKLIQRWLDKKEETPAWRAFVQRELHEALYRNAGAKHFTPFFITLTDTNRSYWLIHLSNHHIARDVMTALHWKHKNQFSHYGDAGIYMFGYNQAKDHSLSDQTTLPGLSEHSKYMFDEKDKERTLESLAKEIPEFLEDYQNGIPWKDFYKTVCNYTPATIQIIKEGLQNLLIASDITITTKKNRDRRSAIQLNGTDILARNRQTRFIFGGNNKP